MVNKSQSNNLLDNLDLVFENLNEGVILIDLKGKILKVNQTLLNIGGYKREELVGKNAMKLISIFPMKSLKKFVASFGHAAKGFSADRYRVEAKTRQGKIRTLELSTSLIKKEGRSIGIAVVIRDVTTMLDYQNELKQAEERYKQLFESSNDAIMTLAPPTWQFTSGNPATVKMFGAKGEKEFTSLGPGDVSPQKQPDGQPSDKQAKAMIMKAMKEGSSFFEWTHKRLSGEEFPATVLLSKIKLGEKELLQATVRDISSEKKSKMLLKESEAKYKGLVETVIDWIWEVDAQGKYTYSSPAVRKLLGYSSEEVIGKTPFDFMTKEDAKKLAPGFAEIMKSKKSFTGLENHNVTKEGKVVLLETSGSPILDNKRNLLGYRGIDRDITEQKIAKEKIEEKIEELEKMNKLMIGRELKMVELKEEMQKLKRKQTK